MSAPCAPTPGRPAAAAVETGLACAGCGALGPAHHPFRRAARAAGRATTSTTSWPAASTSTGSIRRPTRTPTRSSATARCSTPTTWPARPGWRDAGYVGLVRELDDAVAAVDGHGFRVTPLVRAPGLGARRGPGRARAALGQGRDRQRGRLAQGAPPVRASCWSCGSPRPSPAATPARPLAIASCGNAALAAAVVARAAERELRGVRARPAPTPPCSTGCAALGAVVSVCPRRPGERRAIPAYLRLQEAVADGAMPVHLPGPGQRPRHRGRRDAGLGDRRRAAGRAAATSTGSSCRSAAGRSAVRHRARVRRRGRLGALDRVPAPRHGPDPRRLAARPGVRARAWRTSGVVAGTRRWIRAVASATRSGTRGERVARATCGRGRPSPSSVAHGILDDETYDWLAVVRAMLVTGGRRGRRGRGDLLEANALAREATGIDADETGTAGVAGLLALARDGLVRPDESVAVVLTGVRAPRPTG